MQANHQIFMCLDLGTKTGWAIADANCSVVSGVIDFKDDRFSGGGMRYLKFKKWLNDIREHVGHLDKVYFEEVRRHMGVDAAHAYGGFMSHLTVWCEENDIPYQGVPVGTIKKHVTGKGNANKKMVFDAVVSLGYSPKDDNEADAIALMQYISFLS